MAGRATTAATARRGGLLRDELPQGRRCRLRGLLSVVVTAAVIMLIVVMIGGHEKDS